MMELEFEQILVWSSPCNGNLVSSEFSPNFDSSNMDASYLLNLPRSGVIRLVTRGILVRSGGLLIRSLNILVMHWQSLSWLFSSSCTVVETHRRSSSQSNEESESSSHKRKSQEKETHFEQQSTAIQNGSPKRQAVNRASRYSSCHSSMKDEESLKVRYEELEKKEKELIRQLEVVHKEKAEIAEQRTEKSNQTKDLMEKAAHRKKDERLMRIVATKLNNLSDQWAKLQSVFI